MSAEETGKVPSARDDIGLVRIRGESDAQYHQRCLREKLLAAEIALRAAEKRAEDAEERARINARMVETTLSNFKRAESALAASQALTQRLREALESVQQDIEVCDWHCSACGLDQGMGETDIAFTVRAALAESPDHVAPAPEAGRPSDYDKARAYRHLWLEISEELRDEILAAAPEWVRRAVWDMPAAQEATASPAPELDPREEMWEASVESATGRLQPAEVIAEVDRWCDERRNAPTFTTLGMVQEYIRSLFHPPKPAAPPEEAAPQAQEEK